MKPITAKICLSAICSGILLLASSTALALGLGQARVSSYLQQPLDIRIDLISRSEAELATVTAGQASAADYQVMGLSASGLNTPLIFEVETDLDDPHIRVTSVRTVSDPVVQLVVEVVWSSGRMLKQYTLFLDPPAFQSSAPLPSTSSPARSQAAVTPESIPTPDASLPEPYEPEDSQRQEPATTEPRVTAAEAQSSEPAPSVIEESPRSERPAVQNEISSAGPPFDPMTSAGAEAGITTEEPDIAETQDIETAEPVISEPVITEADADRDVPDEDLASSATESAAPDEALVEELAAAGPGEEISTELADASASEIPETEAELAATSEGLPEEPISESLEETAMELAESGDGDLTVTDDEPAPVDTEAVAPALPDSMTTEVAGAADSETALEDPVAQETVTAEPEMPEAESVEPEEIQEPAQQQEVAAVQPREAVSEETTYKSLLPETDSEPLSHQVERGETLWGIARDHARGTGTTVNQMMLAIQQQNPEAFNRGNINSLKSGSILRMPESSQASMVPARQAMLEVMRQEDHFRNRWDQPLEPADLPLITDMAPEPVSEPAPVQVAQVEENRLELVPPSESIEASSQEFGQGNSGGDGVSSGESVVEALARAQEELANARQENEYLQDRLDELETELERTPEQSQEGLGDTQLAELEERLRQERQAEEAAAELVVVPPPEVQPWYARFTVWIIVLLVLVIMSLVWALTRQRKAIPVYVDGQIVDESTHEPVQNWGTGEEQSEPAASDDPHNQEREATSAGIADAAERIRNLQRIPDEEAVELDASDPETQLDLARAYIAMNDAGAARRMLEKVIELGNEEQVAEARDMMGEL